VKLSDLMFADGTITSYVLRPDRTLVLTFADWREETYTLHFAGVTQVEENGSVNAQVDSGFLKKHADGIEVLFEDDDDKVILRVCCRSLDIDPAGGPGAAKLTGP